MAQRHVQLMVVWIAVAACGLVVGHTLSASGAQRPDTLPATELNPTAGPRSPERSPGLEMEALQSDARTRMILYPGRFEQADHAKLRRELDAVALMLEPGRSSDAKGR
jgi:hypothetical protein